MPFWLHGRDSATGQPCDPLFIEAESEAEARQRAADAGMTVDEIEFVRPSASGTEDTLAAVGSSEPVRCARCGSDRVVPRATVWDQGENSTGTLQAYVESKPQALFFRGAIYSKLFARICAACGHAELFAEGAEALYKAYRKGLAAEEASRTT